MLDLLKSQPIPGQQVDNIDMDPDQPSLPVAPPSINRDLSATSWLKGHSNFNGSSKTGASALGGKNGSDFGTRPLSGAGSIGNLFRDQN